MKKGIGPLENETLKNEQKRIKKRKTKSEIFEINNPQPKYQPIVSRKKCKKLKKNKSLSIQLNKKR